MDRMLAEETGQTWLAMFDTMEGGVVVFPRLVRAYRSMERLRYSIQAGEVWGPQDVDDDGAGYSGSCW